MLESHQQNPRGNSYHKEAGGYRLLDRFARKCAASATMSFLWLVRELKIILANLLFQKLYSAKKESYHRVKRKERVINSI